METKQPQHIPLPRTPGKVACIEFNGETRRAWLRREQGLPPERPSSRACARQSDFEKSPVWIGVFVAAVIVIVMNCLPASLALGPAARVHATA